MENMQKNILITGGTTGIGRATALLLAGRGAKVFIFGRHENELNDTLGDARKAGVEKNITGITADVSRESDIAYIFEKADEALGELDVLINNAALGYSSITEGSYADWQYIINTNLLGYVACAAEAIKRMRRNSSGHIINIGSMSAETREKGSSLYVATKSATKGLSESLRKEVNPLGIKVTLIEPGAVGTDMQPQPPEEQREKVNKLEMLKAEDIAACVLYVLTQPQRCDLVEIHIRPHLQMI